MDGAYVELFVVKDGVRYNLKIVDMKDITKILVSNLMNGIEQIWDDKKPETKTEN